MVPKLFVSGVSPTCQRVFAVLEHKGIDHERVEIDITTTARSEEFRRLSPRRRKVPLMEHGGAAIVESTVINEYLEEVYPELPMLPNTPTERAYARAWIKFADSQMQDLDAAMVHEIRDLGEKRAACRKILENLALLDEELANREGLFLGDGPSLVDAALVPTLRLVPIWSSILGDSSWDGYSSLRRYLDTALAQPVFERSVLAVPNAAYEDFFGAVLSAGMTFP